MRSCNITIALFCTLRLCIPHSYGGARSGWLFRLYYRLVFLCSISSSASLDRLFLHTPEPNPLKNLFKHGISAAKLSDASSRLKSVYWLSCTRTAPCLYFRLCSAGWMPAPPQTDILHNLEQCQPHTPFAPTITVSLHNPHGKCAPAHRNSLVTLLCSRAHSPPPPAFRHSSH